MKIKNFSKKMLVTTLLASSLITSFAFPASAYDVDGDGLQSGVWKYTNANATVAGSIRIVDLGVFCPYQIGYNVYLTGQEADVASVSPLKYTVYEDDDEKNSNRLTSGKIDFRSKKRLVSGTIKERGCDDTAILKLEFDGNTKTIRSTCD